MFVERAFWLDSVTNTVDMSVGSSRRLLVGLMQDDHFAVSGNIHEVDPRLLPENKDTIFAMHANALRFSHDLSVTIRLYSTETGKVYDSQQFVIPHEMAIVHRERKATIWNKNLRKAKKLWSGLRKA